MSKYLSLDPITATITNQNVQDTDVVGTTANAIPYVSAAGLLAESPNLTWDNSATHFTVGGSGNVFTTLGNINSIGSALLNGYRASANAGGGTINLNKCRGTSAAPAVCLQNDQLGSFNWLGYGGTSFRQAIQLLGTVIEPTPSQTAMGSRLAILTAPLGTVLPVETVRFEFDTGFSMYGANPVIDQNRVHRLRAYTVATLPAGVIGMLAYVTDALAPTFLAAVVGGGTVVTPVFFNGTAWVGS